METPLKNSFTQSQNYPWNFLEELMKHFWHTLETSLKKNWNISLVAKGALAHHLQRRTALKIQNGRQGAPE